MIQITYLNINGHPGPVSICWCSRRPKTIGRGEGKWVTGCISCQYWSIHATSPEAAIDNWNNGRRDWHEWPNSRPPRLRPGARPVPIGPLP